jgi:hypothetical protein
MVRDELDEGTHLACEAGGQSDSPWRGLREPGVAVAQCNRACEAGNR